MKISQSLLENRWFLVFIKNHRVLKCLFLWPVGCAWCAVYSFGVVAVEPFLSEFGEVRERNGAACIEVGSVAPLVGVAAIVVQPLRGENFEVIVGDIAIIVEIREQSIAEFVDLHAVGGYAVSEQVGECLWGVYETVTIDAVGAWSAEVEGGLADSFLYLSWCSSGFCGEQEGGEAGDVCGSHVGT